MRRLVVAVIGGTVLLLGVAMTVLPGPAVVVIPAGLAILATEFLWARRVIRRCKSVARQARQSLRSRWKGWAGAAWKACCRLGEGLARRLSTRRNPGKHNQTGQKTTLADL